MSMLAAQSNYNDTRCVPDSEAYITALYFTCTSLTTVGFGNVSANTKESLLSHYHCPKEWSQQPFFVTMSTNRTLATNYFLV